MSSPDPNLYSDPPIQDLRDMPEDIQHISACFREVEEYLQTKIKLPGENNEQATKRCTDWNNYSEEFDNIILEMHRIATTGEHYVGDFVKTYCDFLSQDNEPVKSKIKRLEQFKEKLCNIFGDGGETLVTFAKKLDSLGRNVQTFGIRLKHLPGNHKEILETVFEGLKTQMNRINSEIESRRLTNVSWGLFSAPLMSLQYYILGVKQPAENLYNNLDSSFISSKEFEKEDLNKKLQDMQEILKKLNKCWKELDSATGECCKKIESIKAQLKCIKRVWMILRSDVEGLLTLLQLTIGDDDSDVQFFYFRLKNLRQQYTEVLRALNDFTHFKNVGLNQPGKTEGGWGWKPWFFGQ